MVVIKTKDLTGFTNKLAKEIEKIGVNIPKTTAKSLQKGIRTRAPIGFTGTLKQVAVRKYGPDRIEILGPAHWGVVDAGAKPKAKYLPVDLIKDHIDNPGSTVNTQNMKSKYPNPTGWFKTKVPEGKGFVSKSLKSFERRAPMIFEKEIAKSLAKVK